MLTAASTVPVMVRGSGIVIFPRVLSASVRTTGVAFALSGTHLPGCVAEYQPLSKSDPEGPMSLTK